MNTSVSDLEYAYLLSVLGNTDELRRMSLNDLRRMFYAIGGSTTPGTADGQVPVWSTAQKKYVLSDIGRDTGQRQVKADLENLWTAVDVLLQRVGNRVDLGIAGLDPTQSTNVRLYTLPVGFRPMNSKVHTIAMRPSTGSSPVYGRIQGNGGAVLVPQTATYMDITSVSFFTSEPFPTTLPGVPAQP